MNWMDILILVIIGWYAWVGLRTGLLAGLAKLLGAFLGLAAAFNFYRPLSDAVNLKWGLVSTLGKWIPVSLPGGANSLPGTEVQLPGLNGSYHGVRLLGDSVSRLLASGILDILCFIIIFLVVSKAVVILGLLCGKMARLLFMGPIDRAGGILLGAAKGVVISGILVALTVALQVPAAVFSGTAQPSWVSLALQKSVLAPYYIKALSLLNIHFPGWNM